jgi:hypothetical protein
MTAKLRTRWYVAHTQLQAEVQTAFHLNRQGFSTYLPRYLVDRVGCGSPEMQ